MPAHAVVEQLTRDSATEAPCAWIIDTDHLYDDEVAENTGDIVGTNEAGITGPSTAPDDLLARLNAGEGRPFRMFDDDGNLYYSGRIVVRDQPDTSWSGGGEEDFGPLWDFGTPNAGAVEIRYQRDGQWVAL